jgi:hypothetical protein
MRVELDAFAQEQFQIAHVLSHPGDEWQGERGRVNREILEKYSFLATREECESAVRASDDDSEGGASRVERVGVRRG